MIILAHQRQREAERGVLFGAKTPVANFRSGAKLVGNVLENALSSLPYVRETRYVMGGDGMTRARFVSSTFRQRAHGLKRA